VALLQGEEARIIRLIKETYYQWAFIRESIILVESHQSLTDQFVAITTSKYEVGNGLGQDVLRAQTERTKFEDRLLKLHQMEETYKARLSALLSRKENMPLEIPTQLEFRAIELDVDSLGMLISDFNPEVKANRASEKSARANLSLARKSVYPDFNIGAQYTQRDDGPGGMTRDDFFSIKAEIAIPLYWKKKQAHLIEQRRIERRQVDEEFQSLLDELKFQLNDLFGQAKRIRDQITVYREGIIPLAEQTLQSALTGYPVGKVDFLTLLSSQGTLLNYELELRQRILEHELVLAKIEAMTGRRII
jgi:outer membrane protein TolC